MVDGTLRARISNEMVRLHSEYYGRGPTKAKVYADGDLIAVVLQETFTPVEKTLIGRASRTASRTFGAASSAPWRTSSDPWWSRRPGGRSGRS
jgi:Na+-translocating membrane potential-generating system (MpsC)